MLDRRSRLRSIEATAYSGGRRLVNPKPLVETARANLDPSARLAAEMSSKIAARRDRRMVRTYVTGRPRQRNAAEAEAAWRRRRRR